MNRARILTIYGSMQPDWLRRLGVFAAGVIGWRATDLSENDAHQQAADLNVIFNQYGKRHDDDRREVNPPIAVGGGHAVSPRPARLLGQ
ncbi:MAG TPA: hypothetical protein VF086_22160 [Propionibacteriaceae bacterium]